MASFTHRIVNFLEHAHVWLPILGFAAILVGILSERVDKGLLAGGGALLFLAANFIEPENVLSAIDFETLSLLLGMMLLVSIAEESRLFEMLSLQILRITQGRPLVVFVLFLANTLVLSSFLNNVTTILIMVPLTLEITRGIGLKPRPFIIGEIICANIGGLLTLIGDPVNTIVGSYAHLNMFAFMWNMGIPVLCTFACTGLLLFSTHRKQFRNIGGDFITVLHNLLVMRVIERKFNAQKLDVPFMWQSGILLSLTIGCFLWSEQLGSTPGFIALAGAGLALAICHRHVSVEHALAKVDWKTLLFFLGLFILVGGVEGTGMLERLAQGISSMSTHPALLLAMLLLGTAVISAFIDNVPFVTIMLPVISALLKQGLFPESPEVLWWTLSLGAVMGGMASPFGSSANIVALETVRKYGMRLSGSEYVRFSLPLSAIGLSISYVYLLLAYEL